jgi:hypothetical protein
MPTNLSVVTRLRAYQYRKCPTPLVLSCAAMAAMATMLASFIGCICRDPTGAALTLLMTFILIELSLLSAVRPSRPGGPNRTDVES